MASEDVKQVLGQKNSEKYRDWESRIKIWREYDFSKLL